MTRVTIKRALTGDRGPPGGMTVDILTAEQLGPKMSRLPNGSLLCRDVPIARVGWMVYGPNETPIQVGPSGVAYVERTADELFSAETIGSFMASTVVDGHPSFNEHPDGVVPSNWKRLAKGFTTENVRRGTGDDEGVLLADLVITDKELIADVLAGKREVSCGYDADYEQTGPGQGRQTRILGNHIALVRKGRCGPRCAIGDQAPPTEGNNMPKRVALKTTRRAVLDEDLETARQKVQDAQEELEQLEEQQEGDDNAVHVHIHQDEPGPGEKVSAKTEDRISAVEEKVEEIHGLLIELSGKITGKTGDGETDEEKEARESAAAKKKTEDAEMSGDSKALADSYAKVLAQAEVLVPGFRMPTFDAALTRRMTVDNMCQARRRCLDTAYATKPGQELIDSVTGGKDLDIAKMDCAAVATVFNAAAGAQALLNNRKATGDGQSPHKPADPAPRRAMTNADINKQNAEFWAKQETAGA
jgi:hypothetical protein